MNVVRRRTVGAHNAFAGVSVQIASTEESAQDICDALGIGVAFRFVKDGRDITSVQFDVMKLIDADINSAKPKINGQDVGVGSNLSWELGQPGLAQTDAPSPDARVFLEFT
ncbi:hypothetical protein [Microvirga tunisiensis]|uniref:Uncharacterized protein n=1 Tax=Microvirga tunisiensis TaxID=2108360 RepID=A0A5N7MTY0_9HYPH|nr:hypothetical protein [Microvirga tunisiensis]MPR09287.1 hypothetical protein [Microvirga tunisiensis]MPR27496.1 hypothetical protein [Microvirga tunisiensis]